MLRMRPALLRIFLSAALVLFALAFARATHNRAGEITWEFIGTCPTDTTPNAAYTYRVTITTYTRTSSIQADRPSLDSVYWGDGTQSSFVRQQKIDLGNDISKNIYINTHTYAGNGSFKIYFVDPNRNEGVVNIPSSVDVPFSVESLLIVDPYRCPNNSPVLTYPPIDRGCVGRTFIHNPNAYDPDGDSLSYELTVCRGLNADPIPGYSFPVASTSFSLDPITGDLTWETPIAPGEYNVAFRIIQWRNGVNMGYVTRDMQILIGNCNNRPPAIQAVADTCVLAGDSLNFLVTAIDPDQNIVQLSASGGPFQVTPAAAFAPIQQNNDTAISRFSWQPDCDLVRAQPYYVQFRANDVVPVDSISLVSLSGLFIRVIGPPPPSLTAVAVSNTIRLNWTAPSTCSNLVGYRIYRRTGAYGQPIPCPCDNGVPAYTGYTYLDSVGNPNTLSFVDNNGGAGLVIGIQYCYLVTAVFADRSESCASPEACASLRRELPVITNADVVTTDAAAGQVFVAWGKPIELDTIQYPGPYEYRLFRSPGFVGASFTQIATLVAPADTTFLDTGINTVGSAWSYRIDFYYTNAGALTFKGSTSVASTVFLTISPTDEANVLTWQEEVPWQNYRYDIFRQNPATLLFDSIASTTASTYTDTALTNGTSYCYFVRSIGTYGLPSLVDPLVNRSQRVCGTPFDNVPPCAPDLDVFSSCNENRNELIWTNPNNTCADDVEKYYIYYSLTEDGGFERIDSVIGANDTTYLHINLPALSGCYRVTAVDDNGNETTDPETVCVDTCRQYVLPSVFTPNGDGKNDLFHPCDSTTTPDLQIKNCPPYRNVKDIDLKLFNRWGQLVFETTDKDINWDGTHKDNGSDCPDGVYYYTCKVNFFRISGDETVELKGYVHLIRGQ